MKKRLLLIGVIVITAIVMLSLYRTFSLSENKDTGIIPSNGDLLLTYSLNNSSNYINVSINEEKYVDINLKNIYNSSVKYGIYYVMKEPKQIVPGLMISIDENTKNINEEILEPLEEKQVTIRIVNNSEYNISLYFGSVVGFEQGDVNSLLEENMILIK